MFVGRLPYVLEKADVHHIFEPFGEILDIKLFRDSTTGKSKGAASVIFRLERDAASAIAALNRSQALRTADSTYHMPLNVKFAREKYVYC